MEESPGRGERGTPSERNSDEPSRAEPAETPSDSQDSPDEPSLAKTPSGTPVGVDDPYEHVDRCDHCTDEGTCRFAFERFEADPEFARERRDDEYRCPVVNPESAASEEWSEWADCPNFASTTDGKACRRCGLEERRMAHDDSRPLLEEHHLSYGDEDSAGEESAADASPEIDPADVDVAAVLEGLGGDDPVSPTGSGADGSPEDPGADDSPEAAGDDDQPGHEITVALCRWCHAKVHKSWARVDDDVEPDPEAIAAREQRRGAELEEASFETAAERYGGEE